MIKRVALLGAVAAAAAVAATTPGHSAGSPAVTSSHVLCFDTTAGPLTAPEICLPDPLPQNPPPPF